MSTMQEVAKKAGVSKATVSRVLSGKGYVSEETRNQVFEAIDALPTFEVPADFPEPAELVRQMREERDDQIVPELRHIR